MNVRAASESADKFRTRAQAADKDYTAGVRTAGPRWAAGVEASEDAWAEGVREAVANKRFSAGARRAGPAKYQDRAAKLGGDRYRTGVAEGAADWAKNTEPYLATLRSVDLGVKGARGSQQNYDRARVVGQALRAKKLELLGQRG